MDPEVAQVFRNSTAVSTANGSSFQMMKMTAVRRRGKQEILDAKAAEARKQAEIEAKLAKYEQYEAQLSIINQQMAKVNALETTLEMLQEKGLVKLGGNQIHVVTSIQEQQQILKERADDIATASQREKESKMQPPYLPGADRSRAGNQLELHDDGDEMEVIGGSYNQTETKHSALDDANREEGNF